MRPLIVTASAIASWRMCKKQYENKYVLLRRPVKTAKALAVGSTTHAGVEVFWQGASLTEALLRASVVANELQLDVFEVARAGAMIEGYYAKYSEGREAFGKALVETSFEFELAGALVQGKRDVVLFGDRTLLNETKTAASPDADYFQRLIYDTQTVLYNESLIRDGHDPITQYDVIRKPALRPKVKETPHEFGERCKAEVLGDLDRYYLRRLIYRSKEEHAAVLADVAETIREMREARRYVRSDKNCAFCDYRNVCAGTDSIDGDNFRDSEAHPELSEEVSSNSKESVNVSSNSHEAGTIQLPI